MSALLKYLLFMALCVSFAACKRTELISPTIEDVYGPLVIKQHLAISDTSIDFVSGERPYFTFSLGRKAPWKLLITNISTGKTKTLQDSSLGGSAKTTGWLGNADVPPSFDPGQCKAMLTFPNNRELPSDSINFSVKTPSLKVPEGILVADFSQGYKARYAFGGSDAATNGIKTVGGSSAWVISGSDNNNDYTIGNVDLKVRDTNFRFIGTYPILETDPEKVWFNIYIHSDDFMASQVQITFQENETEDTRFPGYQGSRDDAFKLILYKPSLPGWNLVSVRYADLLFPDQNYQGPNIISDPSQRPQNTWNGNRNPNRVCIVSIKLNANPTSPGKLSFSYPIFTINGPLNY
jgi:hypothetical protein